MWAEQVVPATIDSRIWPIAAVVAERLWSPTADRDTDDMYRRLAVQSLRLDSAGIMHISGPEQIMRSLAGTSHIQPLEVLISTLQPVSFSKRSDLQRPSTTTVFDRLVDAVRPDPPLRHELPLLVDSAIHGDIASIARLDTLFHTWIAAAPALNQLEANSPVLQEATVHIAALPNLGSVGVEALSYLQTRKAPPAGWLEAQQSILRDADKPQELVDFVVLAPLQKLVEAASVQPRHN
jgi:hexosaminidase